MKAPESEEPDAFASDSFPVSYATGTTLLACGPLGPDFRSLSYLFGMAEINARNALFTASVVVKTFATSGSITATMGYPSFGQQNDSVWLCYSQSDILLPCLQLYES